jgi:hypothetical protein
MDDTKSIWDVMSAGSVHGEAEVGEGEGSRAAGPRPAASRPSYLEQVENTVTEHGRCLVVRGCTCRSRFCPRCAVPLGLRLQRRLAERLASFRSVYMISLTIDPQLFSCQKDAYEYVRDKRCVARLVALLGKRGCLHTSRYFYVVEWQEDTEMPHFHLLLEADFIPFDDICEAWNSFRPEHAGPVLGNRPGFGSVRFSKSYRGDRRRFGANYVCKYLTKIPVEGYPKWVLESRNVRRFSTSRGFWGSPVWDDVEDGGALVGDFEDAFGAEVVQGDGPVITSNKVRTIGERIADCCQNVSYGWVYFGEDEFGNKKLVEDFAGLVPVPLVSCTPDPRQMVLRFSSSFMLDWMAGRSWIREHAGVMS